MPRDRSEELVESATDTMLVLMEQVRTGQVEVRNGREAADLLRAANEVARLADDKPTEIRGDRATIILQAAQLTEQVRERAALAAAVPEPEVPIIEGSLTDG